MKMIFAAALLATASVVGAQPLTVRAGESWIFKVNDGQPANAHKVQPVAKPGKGELMISVRALFGTTMIVTNNSAVAYRFNAELVPARNMTALRTCSLPTGAKPIVEQWNQRADAVRVSNFRATENEGRC